MPPAWPLVGRDDELALIALALGRREGGASLVLAGPAGVGKTRLASEALAAADTAGAPTARVVASRAASTIPLGALAPLLPEDDAPPESRLGLLRQAARALAARGAPDRGPLVLAVDDAHLLDDTSATLVHQLAVEGTVRLLLTVRTGEPVPDPVALLWKDGLAERLELSRLLRDEVDQLAVEALGGPVDGGLLEHLWRSSEGNPLFLRELIAGGVESGSVRQEGNLWRQVRDLAAAPRLVELVEARLAGMADAQRQAVDLLAMAETLGLATLEAEVGADVVEDLERRGVLTVASDGARRPARLSHPLYGEVRRQEMPAVRARAVQRRLAAIIESAGMRRRDDVLRVAILRLDADGSADPVLLAEAARLAWYTYDMALEERLSRAAVAAKAGIPSVLLLAEVLRWAGRHDDVEQLLSGLGDDVMLSDADRAVVAIARSEVLHRGLDRFADARAVLEAERDLVTDPAWRDELEAQWGSLHVYAGDLDVALAVLEPLFDRSAGRVQVAAGATAVPALSLAGRVDRALEVADRAMVVALEVGRQPSMVDPAVFMVGRCLALAYAGRLDEALPSAQLGYQWSVSTAVPAGRAWFAMILGLVEIQRGAVATAARYFEEGALAFRDIHDGANERWCLTGMARSLGLRREVAKAEQTLAQVAVTGPRSVGLMDVEQERAAVVVSLASGGPGGLSEAASRLLAAAAQAQSLGQHALEALALHDIVRISRPGRVPHEVIVRLDALGDTMQGPTSPILRDHARALQGTDVEGLLAVADRFEAHGSLLHAADAAAQAATAAPTGRGEAAARRRAGALIAQCEGAVTPAIAALEPAEGGGMTLTRRELEVCRLAASGLTSREIADRLFVSVRTVDNQLQRAYAKLGIGSRAELTDVLDAGPASGFVRAK